MAFDSGLIAWAKEALEPMGIITHRPMMGAAVLYCDGVVFAVVDEEAIYFKSDAVSAAIWNAEGCPPFTIPGSDGEAMPTKYRRAPDDVYDDAEAMRHWAALGVEAGQRSHIKRKKR